MKAVNFLDITLNLTTETYQPYTKPNDQITYVDTNSSHPRNILKALPDNISQRINKLSSDEIFLIMRNAPTTQPYQRVDTKRSLSIDQSSNNPTRLIGAE